MVTEFRGKNSVFSIGDIVKTNDGRVLVVKDNEIGNKVYLVLGIYDDNNSTTANIFLNKNFKLQTSGSYYIEEKNTIRIGILKNSSCGGVEINDEYFYKFPIVCCELKEVKPGFHLEKLDDFVEDSGCCDRLCNWCKNLCP